MEQTERSADAQLDGFLDAFTPEVATLARGALDRLRARLPGAVQIVYDNYNALAIGFGPSERASEALFSIAVFPRNVSLFFLHGATLPDPDGVLRGGGQVARHIVLGAASDVDAPATQALIQCELDRASPTIAPDGAGRLLIRSISATQRPRRPRA